MGCVVRDIGIPRTGQGLGNVGLGYHKGGQPCRFLVAENAMIRSESADYAAENHIYQMQLCSGRSLFLKHQTV